jgi:outer membrane protein OmpA-like peptidoglycan-associated protein
MRGVRLLYTVSVLGALAAPIVLAPSASAEESGGERQEKLPPLKVQVDKSKVDLERRRLEVRLSRKPSHVVIKVFGESGDSIGEEEHDFSSKDAGEPLVVRWKATSEPVARIEVWGYDKFGYHAGVRLVPWSFSIPDAKVNFATDSADIRPKEEPKLEATLGQIRAALKKYKDIGPITLYIAAHTDTVGTAEYNLRLSGRRARSIAAWFRRNGLRIPIAYDGLGETALLVRTADEVDEAQNRRVDYFLSVDEPRLKTSGRVPAWKKL